MKKKEPKKDSSKIVIHEMPEDVKYAPKPVQDKWLEWKKSDEENRYHPDRYHPIINKSTGDTVTLDLLGFSNVIEGICRKNGLKKKEIDEILAKQKQFYNLKQKKSALAREWKRLLYGHAQAMQKSPLDIERAKIIDLFGKYYTAEEVWKICNQQMGMCVDITTVRKFRLDNEVVINQKKAEYILKRQDFRLATETGRLEELSDLYGTIKQKFEMSGGKLDYSKELRALIDSIRKEVKGDEIKLTVDGKIDINATIQANKNVLDLARKIPIHMLVIGLVAARQNIDPTQIMGSLATSYYSKLNGFNGMVDETPREIVYPSTIIKSYDWGEIRRIAENENETEAITPFTPSITYSSQELESKAVARKQNLLDTIKRFEELQKQKQKERGKDIKLTY